MTTQIALVEDVTSRQAQSARGPFDILEVQMGGLAYRARKDVWDQAHALKGHTVIAETRSEQKGQWTNYYVDSLIPNQDTRAPAAAVPTSDQVTTQYVPSPPPTQPPMPMQQGIPQQLTETGYVPSIKDRTIWRQTATKVASDLRDPGDSEADFWANVEKLIWFYETGQHPGDEIEFG